MTAIQRCRVVWTGFNGSPGVSTFYGLDGVTLAPLIGQFFNGIKAIFPTGLQITVEQGGDTIEDTTGVLLGAWGTGGGAGFPGSGAGGYSAPAGEMVRWSTGIVLDGHRVRGRTFLVPIIASAYDTDGTITAAAVTELQLKSGDLVTGATGNLLIWHRPRVARAATATRPAVTARLGGHAFVTGSSAVDKAVVLRSRRD